MTTPTFNKFKSTTIYGAFNNADYEDNSIQASANIQRNLTVGGDIVVADGNIKGKKLFYDNVDISSTFVSNTSLTTALNSYANLGNASFYGSLTAVTPITSDISTKVATTSFVSTKLSATLTSYALLSSATFTGPLKAITQASADNSTLVATTAYVQGQGYLTSASLSNYALSSTLSNYALLSGSTFTGNVSGLTATTTDNTTKFATTAFVKNQNYLTTASLSPYALSSSLSNYALSSSLSNYALSSSLSNYVLSSSLSNYALLSGSTFSGTVNFNNGLTTAAAKDVHISGNNTFPTTNSGGKQGLGFFWNQSGGRGEVNLLTYGQGGAGGLSIWNSNVSNAPSKIAEFYPDFCSFENNVTMNQTLNVKNTLNITQPSSTTSPILQFLNNLGQARALIYPSVSSSVLRFSIIPNYGTNGFEWDKSGTTLMSLDSSGNLSIAGNLIANTSSTIPPYSTRTIPTTNTLDNFQGNYWTQYSVRPTNSVTTLNGVTTVNIGLPLGSTPNTSSIIISNTFYALGTVANPDTALNDTYCLLSPSYGATPTNTTNFFNINMYNANTGARIRGYGTLLKSFSTNSYGITFIATDGVGFAVNTPYYYDPFQFTYV